MKVKLKKKKQRLTIIFFWLFLIFFFSLIIKDSFFLKKNERTNILFYGSKTAFYSIGLVDKDNYFISFPSEIKVLVPGGFGYYRIGALGKLVALEKRPDLYQKTFSLLLGNFVDCYFYPKTNQIFFGQQENNVFLPSLKMLFLNQSNCSFINRLYLFLSFLKNQPSSFKQINYLPVNKKNYDLYIDQKRLSEYLIGFFYKKELRNEKQRVQIIYSKNLNSANLIGQIIQGEGIWVVDFNFSDTNRNYQCQVIENKKKQSLTAKVLVNFFNCQYLVNNTGVFDIILKLNRLEDSWAVE